MGLGSRLLRFSLRTPGGSPRGDLYRRSVGAPISCRDFCTVWALLKRRANLILPPMKPSGALGSHRGNPLRRESQEEEIMAFLALSLLATVATFVFWFGLMIAVVTGRIRRPSRRLERVFDCIVLLNSGLAVASMIIGVISLFNKANFDIRFLGYINLISGAFALLFSTGFWPERRKS